MSWIAPAIVAILSGSVILAAVFLYLYSREREPWMGVWGAAWVAYSVRFGGELYAAMSGSSASVLTASNNLLVLVTGVLLLDGTYLLSGRRVPRWHRMLAGVVAVWTITAPLMAVPAVYASSAAWIFRGVANIAAGLVWYRGVKGTGPWGKITGVAFIIWGLHNLDYPLLRGVAAFAPAGFMLGAFLEFIIAFGALIAHFERTRGLLRESESRYRMMFEDNASVMLIVDPEDGRIIDANAAAVRYYGWTRDALTRMNLEQINTLSPEEIASQMELAKTRDRTHFDFRHKLASGEVRDVEVYSGSVNAHGKQVLCTIVHDVTDRVRTERSLRENEERYSTLFKDSLSPMLTVSTDDATILDANAAASRMYGWLVVELIGKPLTELSFDSPEVISCEVADTVAEGGRVRVFRHRRSDGQPIDVEVYSTPVISGARTVLHTIVNDVSARVQAQRQVEGYQQHLEELVEQRTAELSRANAELEEASRAKDEYLANMSHELRTPLNSVIGFSSVLVRGMAGDLNEEQGRQVQMINNAGMHLLGVVDGILDLARIAAGRIDIDRESVNVSELCQVVSHAASLLASERGLEFASAIEADICAETDATILEQILWNLVGNAIKFTEKGSVRLSLSTSDTGFVMRVADTGRGLRPQDSARIFETFVRLDDGHGTRTEGSGLGLPIAKRLTEALGGAIALESDLGVGSTFTVEIPR